MGNEKQPVPVVQNKNQALAPNSSTPSKTPPQFQLQAGAQPAQLQAGPGNLQALTTELNNFNVDEGRVISLCGQLNPAERAAFISDPKNKDLMADSLNANEMGQAVNNLQMHLLMKLNWLTAAAGSASDLNYGEVRRCITASPPSEYPTLNNPTWRAWFVDVCDDDTMVQALCDLRFDAMTSIKWLAEEGVSIVDNPDDFWGSIAAMDDAAREALRSNATVINLLFRMFTTADFARLAANLTLVVPSTCDDVAGVRSAALEMLKVQLANKDVAKSTIQNGLTAVVIPRSKLMTDLPQFSALAGTTTFDGRPWEPTRGVGYGKYVAMAEENILGGNCTATFNGAAVSGSYAVGYSTATHEFAHGLHDNSLSAADRKIISDAYDARKVLAQAAPTDVDQWVDGKEGCYASQTDHEFFAQLSNAYLGTNTGTDPNTSCARHNGKEWVRSHEPTVFALLERMYVGGSVSNANPARP